MNSKTKFYLVVILMYFVQISFAQERTVSGTVTDVSGLPLPGVSIVIKGTSTGTQTDFDGKYSIKALSNQVLVFSFLGTKTQEMAVTSNLINVKLEEDEQVLEGVIVTAQGIKREKQALGYAVSEVKAEQLEQRSEGDIGRVLNGKASGVVINQASGISGSATNIIIRGYTTITGSNQPLFIVDGVPFNSDTNASGNFNDGNSGSSRFLDLDPNNIESINVLKGFAAATLYGTQGKNGVILVTTKSGSSKKGSKKTEITLNQSVFMNEIASLPDYQNTFGNGFDQAYGNFFSNWGPGFYANGLGGWSQAGSGIGSDGTYLHPYSRANLAVAFPELQGVRLPWEAKENNVKDFFNTGTVLSTNLNISGSSDDQKSTYNVNFGYLDDEGFTPGNSLNRVSLGMGGRSQLSNKFTVSGTMNYSKTDFKTPPVARSNGSGVQGDGLSVFADIFYTPRNVDLQGWPSQNPITGANVSYRSSSDILNPYWTVNNSFFEQLTNRVFGNAALNFEINSNLNLVYRLGYDFYNERNVSGTNRGAPRGPVLGIYETFDNNNLIMDHNFLLNGNYTLSETIGMTFNLGATSRMEQYDRQGVSSTDQGIFDIFRHFNFSNQSPIQYTEERNIIGVYGQADFDYKKFIYVTLSARNDWVSNLQENSAFYPSASVAFIPTKVFDGLTSTYGLNTLKIRAGWGNSAGFATGYPIANTINGVARNFSDVNGVIYPSQNTNALLGNPNLKPELFNEIEIGIETQLVDNRIILDASYFDRTNTNLITQSPIANSTGYLSTFTNIGRMEGDGFEFDLGLHIVKNNADGFNWRMNTNFTTSKMIVKDLGGSNNLTIAGFTNLGNQAIVGEQLGVMVGNRVLRDANGNMVVNSAGAYEIEEGNFIIGNPNPNYILNNSNTFSYKNISLSFLFSYTDGGDFYSQTISTLLARGLTTDTNDRLGTFILPGVTADGNPNTTQINASAYYFDNIGLGADELRVYDASVIRLQELSLGYDLPKDYLRNTPFGALTFTFSGNNLYYNALNTPKGVNFDPNVIGTGVGNGRGFDFLNGPTSRRFGFSLKATF
ncbi:SusC/RagA family TonB-linked outer membrane protein [Flavobacterium sp.]|uniref:SusC/RagA family TonB-linked outer membrane protein n=1 Tax=Flavobacterium sp. TaxID=239 RepID=UPI0037BEF524